MQILLPSRSLLRSTAALAFAVAMSFGAAAPARAGGDWNDSAVAWKPYEQGLAEAKETGKPVCLIFYTDWCPHCTNYSKVFHDPAVVETSGKLVMIRVNKDQGPETKALSAKYAPDGEYIPRTYFLKPDGTLLAEVTADRPNYKFFYDEHDPKSVLKSMQAVAATSAVTPAAGAAAAAAGPAKAAEPAKP